MVYIVELKTTQTAAVKILTDTLNSLLTDVNLNFYPYHIDDSLPDSDYESDDSDDESDDESDNESEEKTLEKETEPKSKKIGGVIIKEVNKTSSILVHCRLDADKFEHYKYDYPKRKLTIGVNLNNLLKCLKCMTHFDTMTWAVDDEDINKLIIILESTERNEKKTFRLNLMDLEDEKYEVDPVQFPYSINLPSSDFHKYCKDMASVADNMEIKCTNNRVFLSGKGGLGIVDFEVGESLGGLSIDINTENSSEIVQGLFELKYLIIFTKCTNLCNSVSLYLKNDYPLIVKYSVAALGEIKLVLSPSKS
jgi:proliferating cell nuclear antigen